MARDESVIVEHVDAGLLGGRWFQFVIHLCDGARAGWLWIVRREDRWRDVGRCSSVCTIRCAGLLFRKARTQLLETQPQTRRTAAWIWSDAGVN